MEPRILLVGKIGPIMDILRDELNDNCGRNVISASSAEGVEKIIGTETPDIAILGAGFDDETRDPIAARIQKQSPDTDVILVPRTGEKGPAKLVEYTNARAIEWKFKQVMGGAFGGPGGPGGPR